MGGGGWKHIWEWRLESSRRGFGEGGSAPKTGLSEWMPELLRAWRCAAESHFCVEAGRPGRREMLKATGGKKGWDSGSDLRTEPTPYCSVFCCPVFFLLPKTWLLSLLYLCSLSLANPTTWVALLSSHSLAGLVLQALFRLSAPS